MATPFFIEKKLKFIKTRRSLLPLYNKNALGNGLRRRFFVEISTYLKYIGKRKKTFG